MRLILLCLIAIAFTSVNAQKIDSTILPDFKVLDKYANKVGNKLEEFNKKTEKYTSKALDRLVRQEKKMMEKMGTLDSLKAKELFTYSIDSLQRFKALIISKVEKPDNLIKGDYFPYIDTLKQSLAFLKVVPGLKEKAAGLTEKLGQSSESFKNTEGKLAVVENIKIFIAQRQSVLKDQLTKFPQLASNIKKFGKEKAYYSQQIAEYKSVLQEPEKIEKLVTQVLGKVPAFQSFLQRNSQMAGIFAPLSSLTGLSNGTSIPIVNGIPNRATLLDFVQSAMPSISSISPLQQLQQGLADYRPQMEKLQAKLNSLGGSGNKQIPDFKPDQQHTKPFLKRLEPGIDLQVGKSVNYLPTTLSIAAKVGYKITDKSSAGIGINYIAGLGNGWQHINFSSQGIGFRTYLKIQLKKGIDLQGGGECNYMTQFKNIEQLKSLSAWQQSALLGLSKSYVVGKKLKGNCQVFYDFLYKNHKPATQPVIFRFGYTL